ncbi:rCG58641 [Rattus norvegicus]|uniref:RCG58641 n=1 Tax=Rattus norvegicus TaxID=10116 RepID=A6JLL1_RAT|nr:rCG58641 [Rattus norvegicus]
MPSPGIYALGVHLPTFHCDWRTLNRKAGHS